MLNNLDFIKKLSLLMEHKNLTASGLADKLNINRSSISHIISGRNKPSLDFVMNLVDTFKDELSLEWLLYDKGKFPSNTFVNKSKETNVNSDNIVYKSEANTNVNNNNDTNDNNIDHIIIFYKDGSFKSYKNN